MTTEIRGWLKAPFSHSTLCVHADGEQVGRIYDGVGVRARLEGWPGLQVRGQIRESAEY